MNKIQSLISSNLILRSTLTPIFYPISKLLSSLSFLRRITYNYSSKLQTTFHLPVISVGNISMGGTGKTPFIIWLSKYLIKKDLDVCILSRGYKSGLEHSHGIIDCQNDHDQNDVQKFGDETILLSRNLKQGHIIVGKKRAQNFNYYLKKEISPDLLILDDGFQHLKIFRDLNIVLIDSLTPLSHYRVFPLGELREDMSALKDADVILMTKADQVTQNKRDEIESLIGPYLKRNPPICHLGISAKAVYDVNFHKKMSIDELKDLKIITVCALGAPESFFNLLKNAGAVIVDSKIYPDHHFFSPDEINELLLISVKKNAIIICSEKDIVKIRKISVNNNIHYIGIDLYFLKGEEKLKEKLENLFIN